jgi:hypothetical protein
LELLDGVGAASGVSEMERAELVSKTGQGRRGGLLDRDGAAGRASAITLDQAALTEGLAQQQEARREARRAVGAATDSDEEQSGSSDEDASAPLIARRGRRGAVLQQKDAATGLVQLDERGAVA